MFALKVRIWNISAKRFLYRSLWAQIFEKKFRAFQKPRKKYFLGQDRPEKNSAKCLFETVRFRVLDRHRPTKPTTAPWNLHGARSLGAPTHPLVTMFTKRPVIRGGRRPGVWYKYIWALLCRNQATKLSLSNGKKWTLFQVWEKSVGRRGQLLAP